MGKKNDIAGTDNKLWIENKYTIKMLKKQTYFFIFLLLLAGITGFAQTLPVTISTQMNQPSPIHWRHYADAATSNSPIKIQIVLNDLTIARRQVRLKCYWQGNGISFMNNDFVVGAQPLFLEGGVPELLNNTQLAPYFEFRNLIGLTPNQYAQPIPEGIYTFSVEVYDVATGQKLSRKSNVITTIFQNDPPLLNLPLNKASIMQQNIQNIIFSWSPRTKNVSNVEYQFDLIEIQDKYTPIQNAFAYSQPIYTTTTRATTLLYGLDAPQLIPTKNYAWRIKAKAIVGAEEIGVFKNNGYSEIFSFSYDVYCTAPLQVTTDGVSQDQAKITWSGALDNFDYQVNYREKNADSQWYPLETPRENATLANLKPNTTYEYTVGASCEKGKYVHSSIQEFTTLAQDEIAFTGCGIKPDPKDLANQNPLENLLPNDVVTAGDFPIVVIKASGSNGRFTGEGYVTLPFLEKFRALIDAADALGGDKINIGQFSRIRITFDNIGVNTDFKLISGEIIASYDPEWGSMIDGDKLVDDIKDLVDEYDPIMESIFGPKPTKEETDTTEEEGNTNPTISAPPSEAPIEYIPITDVKVDEPEPTPPPIKNTNPVNNENVEHSTAPSKGEVTENGYYLEYQGQKYYNNGKINIPFNRNLLAHNRFKMGKLENNVNVKYELTYQSEKGILAHKVGDNSYMNIIESKTEADFDFSYTSALNYKLKSTAEIDKSPSVSNEINLIVKPFNLKNLKAIDLDKKNRFANAGQILYYVNTRKKESKDTKIEAVLSQTDPDKIPKDIIKWKINDIDDEHLDGKTTFTIPLSDKSNVKTSTYTNTTGYPTLMSENVTVKWMDFYKIEAEVVPAGTKKALNILSDYVNRIGTVFHKLDPSGELEFKVSYTGEQYIEEDEKTRFYNTIREGGISGQIGFNFKGLKYGLPLRFVEAYIYLKPIISVAVAGKMVYIKRNDKNNYTKSSSSLTFGPKVDLEAGGTIEIKTGSVLEIKAEPFAGVSTWGEIKYSSSENTINSTLGVGKPFIGIRGEITVGGYSIVPSGEVKKVFEDIKAELPPFKIPLN